jgi:hypothetical protein
MHRRSMGQGAGLAATPMWAWAVTSRAAIYESSARMFGAGMIDVRVLQADATAAWDLREKGVASRPPRPELRECCRNRCARCKASAQHRTWPQPSARALCTACARPWCARRRCDGQQALPLNFPRLLGGGMLRPGGLEPRTAAVGVLLMRRHAPMAPREQRRECERPRAPRQPEKGDPRQNAASQSRRLGACVCL